MAIVDEESFVSDVENDAEVNDDDGEQNFKITPSNDHINGVVDNIHQAKD
jgi:hypothetical protein